MRVVPELAPYARGWPDAIADVVEAAIDAGEIAAEDLAVVVVAPTRDWLTLGVWLDTSARHGASASGDPAGLVPLDAWLDEVDAFTRSEGVQAPAAWKDVRVPLPVRFPDPVKDAAWRDRIVAFREALVAAAQQAGAGRLAALGSRRPVGLFVALEEDEDALLVGFCHPQGAPVWPLHERRRELGTDAYPWGALVDEGLVVFYPEGEGDGLEEPGEPAIRAYRFDDMARAARAEYGALRVWLRGQAAEVSFSPGHTREEDGGPGSEEVASALLAHFRRRPALWPSEDARLALPPDGAALAALLDAVTEDDEKRGAVRALVERHGAAAVGALVGGARLAAPLLRDVRAVLAEGFLAEDRPAEALEQLDAEKGAKGGSAALRAEALWALGRHDEVVAAKNGDDVGPFRALSLATLGRVDEALELVRGDGVDALAARAVVLARAGQVEPARGTLRAALAEGSPEPRLLRLAAAEPALSAIAAEREAWSAARQASAAEAAEAPVLAAPFPAVPWDVGIAQRRVLAAPLEPEEPPARKAGTRGEAAAEVRTEAPPLRCALRAAGRTWAGDATGALVELSADGGRREASRPFGKEAIAALGEVPGGLLASTDGGLALLDADGRVVDAAQHLFRGNGPLAAFQEVAALGNGSGIDLYRAVGALSRLGTLSVPGGHWVTALAFAGRDSLVALQDKVLWVADVRDPLRPRWRGQIRVRDVSSLASAGDVALALDGKQALVLSFRDPDRPVVGRFLVRDHALCTRDGDELWIAGGGGRRLRVSLRQGRATEAETLVGPDGYLLNSPLALWAEGEVCWAVTEAGLLRLAPLPAWRSPEGIAAEVARQASRVGAWAKETLKKWLDAAEASPLGVVRMGWFGGRFELEAAGPSSAPEAPVAEGRSEALSLAGDGSPAAQEPAGTIPEPLRLQRMALEQMDDALAAAARARALPTVAGELRALLAGHPRAAREVLLLGYDRRVDGHEVLEVVPGGGTAGPRRAEIAPRPELTLRERLTRDTWYLAADRLAARARRDAAFRREVLDLLAREALPAAAEIAHAVGDVEPDAARAAWLAAAERDPALALGGLLDFADHPDVRRRLEALCDSAEVDVALVARRAVGRLEEPATMSLLHEALSLVVQGKGEAPVRTLAALSDERLAVVVEPLAAAHAALAERNHPDAKELLLPLVRAGVDPLPPGLVAAAEADRRMEGDEELFGEEGPAPAASALRLHVVRTIAATLSRPALGDVWPAGLPVERTAKGWHRLFEIAWPRWGAAELLDELHRRLAARVAGKGSKADVALALHLHLEDVLRADPRAEVLGAALEQAELPPGRLEGVRQLARLGRVQFGWTLVKEGRLAEARRLADAVLAEAPDDGQIRFFDARLAWLEKNDPAEALRRIPAALERAEDGVGRGRLCNLHGAALDALGMYAESIPWFEKAIAADPGFRASALSNIAEAHWKLGQRDEALRFARTAASQGARTEIVKTILDQEGT